jgi:hypothetical protein
MYSVDELDQVIELGGAPQSSVGAPLPLVLANENRLSLAFFVEDRDPAWDGTTVRVVSSESAEPAAIVTFDRVEASYFGPPNDEAFAGHPLAARGLQPYGAFEVKHSSWIRSLERMNSVHPYHRPEAYRSLRHFIFTFHDSIFECVAEGLVYSQHDGSLTALLPRMLQGLE